MKILAMVLAGALVQDASIRNSIIRREVIIEPDVEIEDCIIMDYTVIRRGSRLKRVIVDRFNDIAVGTHIGFDAAADRSRYQVSEGGVVVLPKLRDLPDVMRYEL